MRSKFLISFTLLFSLISGIAQAAYFNDFNAGQNYVLIGPVSGGSGTAVYRLLQGADLPNPGASSLGGVESFAAVSHQFLTQISTSGVVSAARPACGDLSNSAASCSTDTTNAGNISSGLLGLAEGGTDANLSATGGAHQVLKQSTSGGAITVGQLSTSDISGLAPALNVVIKTTTYTGACGDVVFADGTSAAFTVTLPAASSSNCEVKVAKIDSTAHAITVAAAGSDTITGDASVSLPAQWDGSLFDASGTTYWAAF